jgi:hypothetical protein
MATPKAPNFGAIGGEIKTGTPVQFGCVYCLAANLEAPAENHVAYIWQGTTMCASHLSSMVFNPVQTPQQGANE